MTAQLFLPHWLVDRMVEEDNLDAFAAAEEITCSQAYNLALGTTSWPKPEARWIEHDGLWEVRVD